MKIKWLGHACFLLTSQSGVRVLTDPFDDQVGYELPDEEADIVTTSHGHYDHNNTGIVKGDFKHFDGPGEFCEKDISIKGISTFHDEFMGTKRGMNIIYKFGIDDLNICHCGDLGHILTPELVMEIGKVDVLLIPIGGIYTVDALEAYKVLGQLKPAVTIPMHFQTDALKFKLGSVEKFLDIAGGGGVKVGKQEIELNMGNLECNAGIKVLDYK